MTDAILRLATALKRESRPILVSGPTASGKSHLALALAARVRGLVINADALQVYRDWRILTARPDPADLAAAPHALFGHVDVAAPDYSVGRWMRELENALAAAQAAGHRPIIVGGTGLYFAALTQGLAEIPPIPTAFRAEVAAQVAAHGVDWAAARLDRLDSETAAMIDRRNPRRLSRALEVIEATGKGLAAWRRETPPPLAALDATTALRIAPDRIELRRRIGLRFEQMVGAGALEEARAVAARGLPPDLPGRQALGAAELIAHLAGEISLEDAVRRAIVATAQYAKRQDTWARNRMAAWRALSLEEVDRLVDAL